MSALPTDPGLPYRDATLSSERRTDDLLARMPLPTKAALLFHGMASTRPHHEADATFGMPSIQSMLDAGLTHFNLIGTAPAGREFAQWHNALQRLAQERPFGIPVTISTDPRHAFVDDERTSLFAGHFSQWPEPIGFAAIGSSQLVREFAEITRREYTAVGIRVALHPQIDLATEPRWFRITGTFGEDAELTSTLAAAYIEGLQGETFGAGSVSTMSKHFPGGGPQKDGFDPHFPWGREQVYPGGRFEHHLRPFRAAIAAGTRQMMPYYGMPVGTEYEEVGFSFNRAIITDLLRTELGFDGIVCTDWNIVTDGLFSGAGAGAARAWGVEHLSQEDRMVRVLEAGVDQFGGEHCPDVLVGLVRAGRVSEARVDESARRLLREKFALGLFDEPFVDEDQAASVVGSDAFKAAGLTAQMRALTLLTNGREAATLPLTGRPKIYAEGVRDEALARFADRVDAPDLADAAILRQRTPFEPGGAVWERRGSLAFEPVELRRILEICATVPTIVDLFMDRPAVIPEIAEAAAAVIANFGATDAALLGVLFGERGPEGNLPFDLPRSDAAVAASRTDVPFDTEEPLFRFGHGLRYTAP